MMTFFDFIGFQPKPNGASKAKERLKIIIAHERKGNSKHYTTPDYLPLLQQELLAVVRKYVAISDDKIKISMEKHNEVEVLELNIALHDPDKNDTDIEPESK